MATPELVAELTAILRRIGVPEAEIAAMDLESIPDAKVQTVVAIEMVPDAEKAAAGTALILQAVPDDDSDRAGMALADVFRLAAACAEAGAVARLAAIISALAVAAAVVLPEDDERTPIDFLAIVANTIEQANDFDALKAEYHRRKASRAILEDLRRVEQDPDAFEDLLP